MMKNTATGLHLDTNMACALKQLFGDLEKRLALNHPIRAYLAGGMAVHLYTGKRVTNDVDVEFSARILLPPGLGVEVLGGERFTHLIYFDPNYNPMFSLLHEDYQKDAIEIDLGLTHIRLSLLNPLDLAVSKIARFAENDKQDIEDLVRLRLVSSAELQVRGEEALRGYVGDTRMTQFNLRDAVAMAHGVERSSLMPAPRSPKLTG